MHVTLAKNLKTAQDVRKLYESIAHKDAAEKQVESLVIARHSETPVDILIQEFVKFPLVIIARDDIDFLLLERPSFFIDAYFLRVKNERDMHTWRFIMEEEWRHRIRTSDALEHVKSVFIAQLNDFIDVARARIK